MKKITLTIVLVFFFLLRGNAQVNNLTDLLNISELSVEGMVNYYQYTWEIKPPIQDTSEKGFVTERYPFVFNRDGKKQLIKKCGRREFSTGATIWLTDFVSSDAELLKRIIKNLPYQGFKLKRKIKSTSMYEDGNRVVIVQTESDENYKLPKGCYVIIVIQN